MTYKDPLIWIKKNELSSDFCNNTINKFEDDPRKIQGLIGDKKLVNEEFKKSTDLPISKCEDWKNEDEVFFRSITECLPEYYEDCNQYGPYFPHAFIGVSGIQDINSSDSGYQIQRTYPGEYYHWHHDGMIINNTIRVLTFIWYLNDIKHDGYTEFKNGMKIQPEQGKLLIFPAVWSYIHRGFPPKSETKYICTGWIRTEITV
jgi:hypothetical protein